MPKHRFEECIDLLELPDAKKRILKIRFVHLLTYEARRSVRITLFYYIGHTIVSVGSLIVPALLSIQYTDSSTIATANSESFSYMIYWTTWVISLLVTTCNALLTLFKIDKKYLYLHTNKELMESEGWQYAQLSGRYSGFFTASTPPSHENQFVFFCHRIEKIRLREVNDEYNRAHEQTPGQEKQALVAATTMKSDPFSPPTPQDATLVKAEINLIESATSDFVINKKELPSVDGASKTTGEGGKMSVSIDMSKSLSPS